VIDVSRQTERKDMEVPTHLILIDKDLDDQEFDITELSSRLDKIMWALIGILISTTTASILLALNLVVK
jgi:hypothetical protein